MAARGARWRMYIDSRGTLATRRVSAGRVNAEAEIRQRGFSPMLDYRDAADAAPWTSPRWAAASRWAIWQGA